MRHVNSDYARYYNRVSNRVGYVFRDRYRSQVVKCETQLIRCIAYIHNNPLKAGVVKNAEEYSYSSYTNYITGSGIVDFDEASKYFDISPQSMYAIMAEQTDTTWLQHNDVHYSDADMSNIFDEISQKYGLSNCNKHNKELVCKIALELKQRCGASLRQIADLTGIPRETLRFWLRNF